MKLRNSFVSIKALSEELNIPLQAPTKSNPKKIEVKDQDPIPDQLSHKSVDKIDKLVKISGLRVRNLKKSMLNDGRLMRLREKFLRRSKSSVSDLNTMGRGLSLHNLSTEGQQREMHRSEIQLHSKEESQNKENEHPRGAVPESPLQNNSTMQRNKVKMGTRVISSQLLNRSYDNIFDDPFERSASGQQSMSQEGDDDNSFLEMKNLGGRSTRLEQDSLKSLSLESIYNTLEKSRSPLAESALLPHAYVVRK
jgi:tyrosine-protein phosphatase non-receptor type 13